MGVVLTKRHRFIGSAFPAVYRNSFAAKVIRKPVGLVNAGDFGLFSEVYRLAYSGIAVLLECGLHTNVPFGADIIGALENFADFSGNRGYCLNTACLKHLPGDIFTANAPVGGNFTKNRVCLEQFFA